MSINHNLMEEVRYSYLCTICYNEFSSKIESFFFNHYCTKKYNKFHELCRYSKLN